MKYAAVLFAILVACLVSTSAIAQVKIKTEITHYSPPRPVFAGVHIGMPQDSAFTVLKRLAARYDTLHTDSTTLLESDSVQIWNLPAYIQLQIVHKTVRTVVINWHPLGEQGNGGSAYPTLRDGVISVLEKNFGRGIAFTNGSLTYHRWETEDGTMEASHSDKYLRVFLRLGKPRS
jgi:hypothetical protein